MIRCFAFAPTLRHNANMAWTALCGACCRGMRQDAASKRCMHALKIFNKLLGHAGAQVASRPLMCCYGPHRVMPSFLRSRTWGQTAMFTDGATLITRLPTQVNPTLTPIPCFSMLFVPFSLTACIVWLCLDT